MENATLVLRTFDANTSLQNTYYVWENINLRNLMGNMYDKYEKFNLCLTSISSTTAGATLGTLLEDTMVAANISGLPFINQTYNTETGNNTNTATLTTFQFPRTTGLNLYFYNNIFLTFGKAQDLCNITIQLLKNGNYTVPLSSPVVYPHCTFIFNIVGIPNESDKLLTPQTRMDKNTGKIK